MVKLSLEPISEQALIESARSGTAGAIVLFLGTTREILDSRRTISLAYEAYAPMAERELAALESEARARWPIIECVMVHRIGEVPASETSIAIAVSTPHRREAFEAGQWLIDEVKKRVPIWKQEQFADGETEWVHPLETEQ